MARSPRLLDPRRYLTTTLAPLELGFRRAPTHIRVPHCSVVAVSHRVDCGDHADFTACVGRGDETSHDELRKHAGLTSQSQISQVVKARFRKRRSSPRNFADSAPFPCGNCNASH